MSASAIQFPASRHLMIVFVTGLGFGLGLAACNKKDDASGLAAGEGAPYTGSLFVAAAAKAGGHELAVGAKATTDKVFVCEDMDYAACKKDGAKRLEASLLREDGGRKIFKVGKAMTLAGRRFTIIATGAGGSEYRTVSFKAATGGTDAAPGAGTGSAGAASSQGSGGETRGQVTGQALTFMVDAPAAGDPRKAPYGLLVFLHGSTASGYDSMIGELQRLKVDQNLILVSVKAPNGQGFNEGGEADAARRLDLLVREHIFKKYDIKLDRVFFMGQSSGAGFLSTNFVPAYAKNYQGGAIMNCGLQLPAVPVESTGDVPKKFKLHFRITPDDGWMSNFNNTIAKYKSSGWTDAELTTNQKPGSGGHCSFSQPDSAAEAIGRWAPYAK